MQGKTRGIIRAYLTPVLWVVAGFVLAELLRWLSVDRQAPALAAAATWVSLLGLVAGTLRALWVSWRIWRSHAVPPAAGDQP